MFALLKSNPTFLRVFCPNLQSNPTFRRLFAPISAWQMRLSQPLSPPICALFKTNKSLTFSFPILTIVVESLCIFINPKLWSGQAQCVGIDKLCFGSWLSNCWYQAKNALNWSKINNAEINRSKSLVYHIITLLAPQSGALRISAYRDFLPIPSNPIHW